MSLYSQFLFIMLILILLFCADSYVLLGGSKYLVSKYDFKFLILIPLYIECHLKGMCHAVI